MLQPRKTMSATAEFEYPTNVCHSAHNMLSCADKCNCVALLMALQLLGVAVFFVCVMMLYQEMLLAIGQRQVDAFGQQQM